MRMPLIIQRIGPVLRFHRERQLGLRLQLLRGYERRSNAIQRTKQYYPWLPIHTRCAQPEGLEWHLKRRVYKKFNLKGSRFADIWIRVAVICNQ